LLKICKMEKMNYTLKWIGDFRRATFMFTKVAMTGVVNFGHHVTKYSLANLSSSLANLRETDRSITHFI